MKRLWVMWALSLISLLGMVGVWILMSEVVIGEIKQTVSTAQVDELSEAQRLNQQAEKLYREGKYSEAIPLAERVLGIRQKILGEHPDVATSLNNLAELYTFQGRYNEAEALHKQALQMRKRLLGNEHPDVATSLNNLAVLHESQGRYNEAEALHKQALQMRERLLGNEHLDLATSLNNLAVLYESQGRYSEAEPLYKHALQMTKRLLGEEHLDVALSLNNLALLYSRQGRYIEAEPLYKHALQMTKRLLGEEHLDVATSLNNLAGLYLRQGRYSEAEPLHKQALQMRKRLLDNDHTDIADSLNNLAALYHRQGRYSEAEPLHKQALQMRKRLLDNDHPDIADSLNNLAGLYLRQGRYSEAEPLHKQALEMRKRLLGEEHLSVASSLNNLAGLYYSQGKYGEAEPLYKQALQMRKRLLGEKHPNVATSLNNLAALYSRQGRYGEAEPLYKQTLQMRKRLLGEKHPNVATSLNNLALLYSRQGRYSEAELLYKQALQMKKRHLGEEHPYVAASLNNLAGLYSRQGNINNTLEYLTQGLKVEEKNLAYNLVSGFERQKRDYIATISKTTDRTISFNLNSALNKPKAVNLALTTILQRKGRILDFLTTNLQILRQRVDDSQSQKLIDELSKKYSQLASLIYYRPKQLKQYRKQVISLEKEVKQLEDKLSRRSEEFRNLSKPLTLEAIQRLIPSDTALVEIVRYRPFNPKAQLRDSFGKPRYAAYVLTSGGQPKAIDLGSSEEINQIIEQFRQSLRDRDTPTEQLKLSARDLDKIIMEPIRKLLGNKRKILISPDGKLNLIPFEALVDENNRYLVENYSFTYLTSGRDLLRLQNKYPSKQQAVVMGDPSFHQQGQVVAIKPKNTRSINLSKRDFPSLEGTRKEAKSIARMLGVEPLLGKSASEGVIKQLQSPEILHIATHGFFESPSNTDENKEFRKQNPYFYYDNPLLLSGLVLSGYQKQQGGGNEDGILTAQETTALNLLGTKLVVLSACDTARGTDSTGEGIYGLRRALVIAGSESQVISLWKVDDNATKELMVKYFERVLANKGRSEALRQTQLEMLRGEEYQHPYYWAAFIPSGEWRPMGE